MSFPDEDRDLLVRSGATLIEIMVGFFLFCLISLALYKITTNMQHTRALGEARATAQREVGLVMGILQKELSQAVFNSFQNPDGSRISFKVNEGGRLEDLRYAYVSPKLTRRFKGNARILSNHLDNFSVSKIATGQLMIEMRATVRVDGLLPGEAQSYTQNQMVVMREDMASVNDPHWRDVGNVSGVFETHGDLMAGLEEDSTAVIEDVSAEARDLAAAARAEAEEKIEEIKAKFLENLRKIREKLGELDAQINDMNWRAVIGNENFWNSSRINGTTRAMKDALTGMRKAGQMDYDRIRDLAESGGFRVKESFESMYNAKRDLFKAGRDIVDAGRRVHVDLSSEFDTSIFY